MGTKDAATKRPPSEVLAKHRDAVLAVAGQHKATHVRVFGSVARGDDLPDGDVDLLVHFERERRIGSPDGQSTH